jgi:hypothetical protein
VAAPLPSRDRHRPAHLTDPAEHKPAAKSAQGKARPEDQAQARVQGTGPAPAGVRRAARNAQSAASPAASGSPHGTKAPAPQPSYDPLAPRLRPTGATPDRQAREREARKARARLSDVEKQIAEKERAVRDVEALMASPGFYEDRARADKAVADRQALLDEVATLMTEWESLQTAAEANG